MDKPEFLVELGPVATDEAFAIGMAKLLEREGRTIAAAELRRLHAENERLQTRYEACDKALRQWLDKTAWIQETGRGCELGMHRADAVRQRLSAVEAQRDALLEQRDELRRALEIIAVGDATNPHAQAAEELIALGYWRDIPEARAAIKTVEEPK